MARDFKDHIDEKQREFVFDKGQELIADMRGLISYIQNPVEYSSEETRQFTMKYEELSIMMWDWREEVLDYMYKNKAEESSN